MLLDATAAATEALAAAEAAPLARWRLASASNKCWIPSALGVEGLAEGDDRELIPFFRIVDRSIVCLRCFASNSAAVGTIAVDIDTIESCLPAIYELSA